MSASATKIGVEPLPGNRSFPAPTDDTALFTFTRVKTDDKDDKNDRNDKDEKNHKNVGHRFSTSAATVCFIRGTGKIAMNDSVVEYGGKWFEIPREIEYQIFPETDTLMLTIQKRRRDPLDMDNGPR